MKYFNRYTKTIEEEKVPGRSLLKFLYHTKCGTLLLFLCFKRAWCSRLVGRIMRSKWSRRKIVPFAKKYSIPLEIFEKAPQHYTSFNDFFCRKFKTGQRSFDPDPQYVCFPAEGRHLGFQTLSELQTFCIKGQCFTLEKLLGNVALAQHFQDATCVISRLSPIDYHRFHFPYNAIPQPATYIKGSLYSVHPIALKQNFRVFGENKRYLTILNTESLGKIAMIEVGACNVGSICETFTPQIQACKGDEKGYFWFGGSTVITLFEYQRVALCEDLLSCTQQGLELYAHVGDVLGTLLPPLTQRYAKPVSHDIEV